MNLLPASTYQAPTRQGRVRQLNTIVEEGEDTPYNGARSDSEGDASDSTVVGKPAGLDSKFYIAAAARRSRLAVATYPTSPVSSRDSSPCSNSSAANGGRPRSVRSSYSDNDDGVTVFSDDSCPSLASDPTTFATDSSRSSIASNRSSRNRYPALLIPRTSWGSSDSPIKELALGMSPSTKILLSANALSALHRSVPEAHAPPSLGDGSSVASSSPCVMALSAPGTPDLRQMQVHEGDGWGGHESQDYTAQPLEIAIDERHSIVLSPAEAHSDTHSSVLSPRWGEMVTSFPEVPGATPIEYSPCMPQLSECRRYQQPNVPDIGIHLPPAALSTLDRLTRQRSPDEKTESSWPSRARMEMRERSEPSPGSRPRSAEAATPLSDFSFTQLSIPSPGGFFSSLQGGARHTWCINQSSNNSVPTSAIAENFYQLPWAAQENVVETVVSVEDTNLTEGPPTALRVGCAPTPAADVILGLQETSGSSDEDDDLYGPAGVQNIEPRTSAIRYEYEEAYEDELKHAAEASLDRTGSWLAAQTSYLSALRETNPVNDPNDYPPTPHPLNESDEDSRNSLIESAARKTVHFLEEASKPAAVVVEDDPNKLSPASDGDNKEPIFHKAFEHLLSHRRSRDAFLHASSRIEAVRSARVALPSNHISSLLGQHTLPEPKRPKYSGPFSQNPRATGVFERTADQLAFQALEKEQQALSSVSTSNWQVEALRAVYHGQLLASAAACDRLANKATIPLTDPECVGSKRMRILDFGGEATASWAWHAAHEWPNVKVYTVNSKDQSQAQRPPGHVKPAGPDNHRTVSVPHLWQLPFRDGFFDVISARSLHALLKSNPIPGVPEIDEWDLTLRECMRVLKPGGYLDYIVMDSSIAKAGALGQAMSVEFGFELHRRGYEREAASSFIRRLKKNGFVGMKRAWMFLPMGRKDDRVQQDESTFTGGWHDLRNGKKPFFPAPRPLSEVSTISKIVGQYMDVEAVQGPVGSTQDVADVTGLLGAKLWEEWLVKNRAESGWEQQRLLDGVDLVIEEGKEQGSGWKVLVGWARKPRAEGSKKETREVPLMVETGDTSPGKESLHGETGMIPMMIEGMI